MKEQIYHKFFALALYALIINFALNYCGSSEACTITDPDNKRNILQEHFIINGIDLTINDELSKNDKIIEWPTDGDLNVHVVSSSPSANDDGSNRYVDVKIVEKKFTATLREALNDYEQKETSDVIKLKLNISCTDGNVAYMPYIIDLRITINDTNNHEPIFINSTTKENVKFYNYSLPMPIPKGYSILSDPKTQITVRDYDLHNKNVTFIFKAPNKYNETLEIFQSQNPSNPKEFFADVKTKEIINFYEDFSFEIVAVDSGSSSLGNDTKNSSVEIHISIDKENSVPEFKETIYTADLSKNSYTKGNNVTDVKFNEKIELIRGNKSIKYNLINTNAKELENRAVIDDADPNILTLLSIDEALIKPRVLTYVLKASSTGSSGTSILQIVLPTSLAGGGNDEKPGDNTESASFFSGATFKVLISIIIIALIGGLGYFLYIRYYRRQY